MVVRFLMLRFPRTGPLWKGEWFIIYAACGRYPLSPMPNLDVLCALINNYLLYRLCQDFQQRP